MIVTPDEVAGYTLVVCSCGGGPYLGARKAGTPCCCEGCGFITADQLDAILAAERAKTAALVEAVQAVVESPDDEQEWERVEGEVTAVQVVDVTRLRRILAEHGAQEQAGGGE